MILVELLFSIEELIVILNTIRVTAKGNTSRASARV